MVCVTHYSLEYIGQLPYPEIEEILDAYAVMKTGKSAKRRAGQQRYQARPDAPVWEQRAMEQEERKEKRSGNRVHVSTLPLTVQQRVAELRRRAKQD